MSLVGKKALVTGASKGLGYAISQKLAELGCSVNLVARNETLLKANVNALPVVSLHQQHNYLKCDLQDLLNKEIYHPSSKESHDLLEHLDNVSILVNCAGRTTHNLLPRISTEEVISTINLNLTVPILLSRLACRPMMKVSSKLKSSPVAGKFKKPTILNISSVLSTTDYTLPGTTVYAALKAGLLGFTKSLASEFKGRIRVNALLPGLIEGTDMGTNANIANDELKPVAIDDVVKKAIEVISNDSFNGQNIILDGITES